MTQLSVVQVLIYSVNLATVAWTVVKRASKRYVEVSIPTGDSSSHFHFTLEMSFDMIVI